jgi:hypothetical protein
MHSEDAREEIKRRMPEIREYAKWMRGIEVLDHVIAPRRLRRYGRYAAALADDPLADAPPIEDGRAAAYQAIEIMRNSALLMEYAAGKQEYRELSERCKGLHNRMEEIQAILRGEDQRSKRMLS